MTHRWQQHITDYLYVITESIAWFMPIALIATWAERDFLTQLAARIVTLQQTGAQERLVLADVEAASLHVISGPSALLVVLTGVIAFALMRAFSRAHVQGGFAALSMLVASVLVLNVMLHLALGHDLRFWDGSGFAGYLNDPAAHFPDHLDVRAFLAHPTVGRPHGAAATTTFIGLIVVWARFLLAGRSAVTFQRAARSFTIGFAVSLAMVVVASLSDVAPIAGYAVPYFVLGVLMLAVAHSARPQVAMEGVGRSAPWVVSVAVTVAALAVAALVLGLLAFLNAGAAFRFVVDGFFALTSQLLVIIVTPVFWVMSFLVHLLHINVNHELVAPTATPAPGPDQALAQGGRNTIGELLLFVAKFAALVLITYGSFLGVRRLLNQRRRDEDDDFVELRSADAAAGGLGGLLRNFRPRWRGRGADGEWMRRHAVYRLFGRAVRDAHARGLSMRPGETPLEFADVGRRMLSADPFPAIAAEFDRARYGRHFADDAGVAALERGLVEWERSHPASEEQRERVRGARELSDVQRLEANIVLAKRASRGDRNAKRLL